MQVKLKKCSGCGKDKVIWKADGKDKYCQPCWSQIAPTKPIKQVSKKMVKITGEYEKKRVGFLALHSVCQANLSGCMLTATEVHHKAGRGADHNKISTWLAVCRNCHNWIENHPLQAKELGFSQNRLDDHE
jgi:hypothetical protein